MVLGTDPNRDPDDISTKVSHGELCAILCNPKAWEAVGKKRQWAENEYSPDGWQALTAGAKRMILTAQIKQRMMRFVGLLVDEHTIDQALIIVEA